MDDIAAADDATLTPLAVDLDGTLVRSDTLHEGVIRAIKARPLVLFSLCAALRHGKAAFKRAAAAAAPFDAAAAPYNHAVLDFLRAERRAGRTLGLFTAADQSIADEVAAHLGLFAVARGSDGVTNLSGAAKADAIAATFGPSFAYAGDDAVDRPIFARARGVVLVGAVERLKATLADGAIVEASFPAPPARFATWMRALRVQHCVKNFLVFAPVILSAWTLPILLRGALLFLLLGALASATYLINDLFDLGSDRQHPHKRRRPLASGDISVRSGAVVACLMIPAALLCSLALPVLCSASLLAYLAVTLAYSLVLKQIPMVDVTVLAGLFTLRVLAGSLLLPTAVSPWLLTFSLLFFFGLAVIKRYAELDRLAQGRAGPAQARGYTERDLPILLTSGIAAGLSAIVIFMVYLINDQYPRAIYAHPGALWAIMPVLLIWTLRLWHLAVHGRMSEDPVVFALKDRTSLGLGAAVLVILLLARL